MICTTSHIGIPFKSSSSYWSHQSEVLFFGEISKITGGRLYNQKFGATDYLTVGGAAGTYTFQCPNTAAYINADTDYIWFKTNAVQRTTTTAELIGYDFARTIVKYENISFYPNGKLASYNGRTDTTQQSIGLQYTLDGITWYRYAGNPIITAGVIGSFDATEVSQSFIIVVNNNIYCYYSALNAGGVYSIGLATSVDYGQTWVKYGQVLSIGAGWEANGVWWPVVMYEPGETNASKKWKMWYVGSDGSLLKIGYAYSADGLIWTKFANNPVVSVGAGGTWDDEQVVPCAILKENSTYYLFIQGYTGSYYQGGLVTFTNPEGTYTKSAGNPIIAARQTATQTLTANLLTGNKIVTVNDSSVFEKNEYVLIDDSNSIPFLARINSIDSPTQLTFDRNVDADYTTAQSAEIRSIYYQIIPTTVYKSGTQYIMLVSAFGAFAGHQREYGAFAYSNSIDGPYTIDFDKGLLLKPDLASTWDTTSMENARAITLQWHPITFTSLYSISEIAILKAGETLTTTEENRLRSNFDLSIWWNGILNALGKIKTNRTGQSVWTIEPITPDSLACSLVPTGIQLDWNDSTGTISIERSTTDETNYAQIHTIASGVKTWIDISVASSTKYYYRLRSYVGFINSTYCTSDNETTLAGYTKSLLHFDGADASVIFTDETGKIWTPYGTAQIDTAQKKWTASGLFNGSTDYINTPNNVNHDPVAGTFTIDFWVKFAATTGTQTLFLRRTVDGVLDEKDFFGSYFGSNVLHFGCHNNSIWKANYTAAWVVDTNWHHLAFVRNGANFYIFLDGVPLSLTVVTAIGANNLTFTYDPTQDKLTIGRYGQYNGYYFNGWIDEFRFSKGIARWTADFSASLPSAPYTLD